MLFLRKSLIKLTLSSKMSYYAVARGHNIGVYDTWARCEQQVKGFKGAVFKKFKTRDEAESFIKAPDTNSVAKTEKTSKFSPRDVAIPLIKSRAVQAAVARDEEQAKDVKEFWPENDGDDLGEEGFSDMDLLVAVAAAERAQAETSLGISKTKAVKRRSAEKPDAFSSKRPKHVSKIWEAVGFKKIGDYQFAIDEEDYVIVYTDGSCINNGQANACAGYGVFFGENHALNAAKPVLGRVTNNVGEIQAAIHAIKVARDVGVPKLCISTDSQFLINAITAWIYAWKQSGWLLKNGQPVKNVADFKELDKLLRSSDIQIKWNYVKAHKGIEGNEMADKLAREGSELHKQLHKK